MTTLSDSVFSTRLWLRFGLYGALFTAWVAMMGSLYVSEVWGFLPCVLCWYQRILMYPLAGLLALGIWRRDQQLPYLILPFSLLGQGVAVYHYLLQKTTIFGVPAACSAGAPCTTIWINWFGLVTIPFLAMVGFMIITFGMLMVIAAEEGGSTQRRADLWPRWPVPIAISIVIGLYAAGVVRATQEQGEPAVSVESSATLMSLAGSRMLYTQSCASCHGRQGEGIDGLGSPLAGSPFMTGLTDNELLALIRDGRSADAVDNRSGIAMPPRGSQTDLSDEQILGIIHYLRSGFEDGQEDAVDE